MDHNNTRTTKKEAPTSDATAYMDHNNTRTARKKAPTSDATYRRKIIHVKFI